MSAYNTLLCNVAWAKDAKHDQMTVNVLDLIEVLAELAALRTGGAKKPDSKYSAEFEEAWALYPTRPGNSKAAAFKAWAARLKAGATALEMIEGTTKYAAYVTAERTEPSYIKQAATFYGPGEHFSADWTVRKAIALPGRREPAPETPEQKEARRARWGLNGLLPGDDGEAINAPY